MSSLSSSSTLDNSEKYHVSQAISVLRVLLCLALAGCSQDDQPTAPPALVEFVFPLEAGTTWHYTYSWSYRYYPRNEEQRGHQVWQSTGTGPQDSVKILVTRIDTMRSWYSYLNADTTTQITEVDTSFYVIVTPDSLYIQWYHFMKHGTGYYVPDLFRIPRRVKPNTDYVNLLAGYSGTVYLNGKGLTQWVDYNSTNYFWSERLILESMSPQRVDR